MRHQVDVSTSSIRNITLGHAKQIGQEQQIQTMENTSPDQQGAKAVITEIDGSMVPIVQATDSEHNDNRRNRQCFWKEMHLSAAREQGTTTTYYGVSAGSVEQAGYQWAATTAKAGWGLDSYLHVVCDGALWIDKQCEDMFGAQANFLVDFYHVCDYLSAAAKGISKEDNWLGIQKERLKENQPDKVLEALMPFIEDKSVEDSQAPVRAAHRYLSNRIHQLD